MRDWKSKGTEMGIQADGIVVFRQHPALHTHKHPSASMAPSGSFLSPLLVILPLYSALLRPGLCPLLASPVQKRQETPRRNLDKGDGDD